MTANDVRRLFDMPPAPTAIRFRFFEGYGLVAASTASGSLRFIYMAGEPPDSVRDACEREKDELVALFAGEGVPPVRAIASGVVERTQRVCYRLLKRVRDFLLNWSHARDATPPPAQGFDTAPG
jgi:hypothetical protein